MTGTALIDNIYFGVSLTLALFIYGAWGSKAGGIDWSMIYWRLESPTDINTYVYMARCIFVGTIPQLYVIWRTVRSRQLARLCVCASYKVGEVSVDTNTSAMQQHQIIFVLYCFRHDKQGYFMFYADQKANDLPSYIFHFIPYSFKMSACGFVTMLKPRQNGRHFADDIFSLFSWLKI